MLNRLLQIFRAESTGSQIFILLVITFVIQIFLQSVRGALFISILQFGLSWLLAYGVTYLIDKEYDRDGVLKRWKIYFVVMIIGYVLYFLIS